jgi:hypothetical protein
MTALGAAGPALAEPTPPPPTIEITVAERVITTDGGNNNVPVDLFNVGIDVHGLVVDFGTAAAPVDPRIGLRLPAGCSASSCPIGYIEGGTSKTFMFAVQPTAELPQAGLSFDLVVHDASATWQESTTITVVRAGPGIDLETAPIPEIKLAAGESAALPIAVRNNGTEVAQGVAVALSGEPYLTFPNKYSNCVDAEDLRGIVCSFDLSLAPGTVFTISPSTPLTVVADKAAPGPADYQGSVRAFELKDGTKDAGRAAAQKAARQPGTELQLVPAVQTLAADRIEWADSTSFTVKVALNPADSVAIGGTFAGKVGDTRTVKIGFRNDGPATVLPRSKDWWHAAKVRTPSGLALTKVDKRCVPNGDGDPSWDLPGQISGHEYLCVASAPLAAGQSELFSFTGKIQDGQNADEGTITVLGGVQDPKLSNNAAKVEVKLTGDTSGGAGGGLPITGAPAGQLAATGLLLVLLGAFTLVLTRRRETA